MRRTVKVSLMPEPFYYHRAGESLNAFFFAFDDPRGHVNRVANVKFLDVLLQVRLLNESE